MARLRLAGGVAHIICSPMIAWNCSTPDATLVKSSFVLSS
jgi:hypothetical protein